MLMGATESPFSSGFSTPATSLTTLQRRESIRLSMFRKEC